MQVILIVVDIQLVLFSVYGKMPLVNPVAAAPDQGSEKAGTRIVPLRAVKAQRHISFPSVFVRQNDGYQGGSQIADAHFHPPAVGHGVQAQLLPVLCLSKTALCHCHCPFSFLRYAS